MKKTLVRSTALVLVFALLLSVFAVFGSVNASAETLPEHTKPIGIVGIIQNRVEIAKEQIGIALGAAKHVVDGAIQYKHDVIDRVVEEGLGAYQEGKAAFAENCEPRVKEIIQWHVDNAGHLIKDSIVVAVENIFVKAKLKQAEIAGKIVALGTATAIKAAVDTAKAAVKTTVAVKTIGRIRRFVKRAQKTAATVIVGKTVKNAAEKVERFVKKGIRLQVAKAVVKKTVSTVKKVVKAQIAKVLVKKAVSNTVKKTAELVKTAAKVKLVTTAVKNSVRRMIYLISSPIYIIRPFWLRLL